MKCVQKNLILPPRHPRHSQRNQMVYVEEKVHFLSSHIFGRFRSMCGDGSYDC